MKDKIKTKLERLKITFKILSITVQWNPVNTVTNRATKFDRING